MLENKLSRDLSLNQKIILFIILNIILLIFLYHMPIGTYKIDLCIFKNITGKECINCGMTRAFLSILHFDFESAIGYNRRVVFVFPLTIALYAYSWYKYIFKTKLPLKRVRKDILSVQEE